MNVLCATTASTAATRPVYVVTARRGKHLFGLHRRYDGDMYTSYVLGFHEGNHALALAKGLEVYHRTHGHFPPRDLTIADMNLGGGDLSSVDTLSTCAVDAVPLDKLTERLRGTGIVLSMLSPVGKAEDFTFRWSDFDGDRDMDVVVARLNQNLNIRDASVADDDDDTDDDDDSSCGTRLMGMLGTLLPKPRWPPLTCDDDGFLKAALAGMYRKAAAVILLVCAMLMWTRSDSAKCNNVI